jgi:hypothetical protein
MATPHVIPSPPQPDIHPLEPGDRLTRDEFERRYEAMPHVKKAELIEGVVYMPSPVKLEGHGEEHGVVMGWLGVYHANTPGVRIGDNTSVQLDLDNEPQPDGLLMIDPKKGGRAKISDKGYVVGGPEIAAEIAATSASYDLNAKLQVYRRNGVQEYVVWRVRDQVVDWFVLRESRYESLAVSAAGIYQSEIMPGLWLEPAALVRGDYLRVHQVLQQGLASPEHAAFLDRLKQS